MNGMTWWIIHVDTLILFAKIMKLYGGKYSIVSVDHFSPPPQIYSWVWSGDLDHAGH